MTVEQTTALWFRLRYLEKKLSQLQELKNEVGKADDLVTDERKAGLVERWLQVSLEAVLDIGKLMIAIEGIQKPDDNTEVFSVLARHGILPLDFAKKIKGMGGLRNILVHGYVEIDYQKVYGNLRKLDDIKKFIGYVNQWLDKKDSTGK